MKFRFVFLFIALTSLFKLSAQTPAFNYQKFGSEEGLNNANIFSIKQHPNGVMYFTTQNGIYTYDGYNFIKLKIDSLKSNALQSLNIANAQKLHLSLRDQGLAEYNLETKAFQLNKEIPFKGNCDQFIENEDFIYFLNSGTELNIVNLKTKELISDSESKKNRSNTAHCIFKSSSNKIYVGRQDGLYEIVGAAQVRTNFIKGSGVYAISESAEGELVLGTSGSIVILKNNTVYKEIIPSYTKKSASFQLNGGRNIEKIIIDKYNRIWFTAFPGESLYLFENNKVYDAFELMDLPPTLINNIYKDRDENIWISTFNDGAYFIQNTYFNSLNFSFGRKILNVNSVFLKNNLLAAGTANGLYGINLNSLESKPIFKPDEILAEPVGTIQEINNTIYFSARSEMPVSYFTDTKNIYKFKSINAAQFYPLDQSVIVADRMASVLQYDENLSRFMDTLISFPNYRIAINDLYKSGDSLLVATNAGLYIYSYSKKTYHAVNSSAFNFIINDIANINGKIYLAHESGITDLADKKLINSIQNINLNAVKKIKSFNDYVWMATLDGILVCDKNFNPLMLLNKNIGLLSNAVSDVVCNNESICIATARGLSIASLKNVLEAGTKLPAVTINEIKINAISNSVPSGTINLSSDQENIYVGFNSPMYSKPNKQYYRYRINNGEWIFVNDNSIAVSISNGGYHQIAISVSKDKINWSDDTNLYFLKEAKITESGWTIFAAVLITLLVISGIFWIFFQRHKKITKQKLLEQQEINVLKHQAMNALLSPHFIFNSLTSIQNYINSNNSLKASEYLAKFSRLIRMIIEKASQGEITLQDELARLTYYLELEKERFKNKFSFEISVASDINTSETKIPNMIIQPHAENCIIHGILPKLEHGTLKINFQKLANQKLLITLEDDGIGLIKAKEHSKTGHKSLGTATIKNILEINSKLSGKKQSVQMIDKSTLTPAGQGTIITIELEL
ncbi:MAG: histidine kinase [Sphingobacteriaceae bacterium]|nr:histidine kinase [Sphingobacteriaceae bacterium]